MVSFSRAPQGSRFPESLFREESTAITSFVYVKIAHLAKNHCDQAISAGTSYTDKQHASLLTVYKCSPYSHVQK